MPSKLERLSSSTTGLALTNSLSTTPVIPFGAVAGGMLFVTAVSSATKIAWHAAPSVDATFVPLYDGATAVETSIAASRAYSLPDAAFAAPYLKAVLDAGTATANISVKG